MSDLVESVADEIFREFDEENEDKRADSKTVKEEAKEDEIVFLCHFCGEYGDRDGGGVGQGVFLSCHSEGESGLTGVQVLLGRYMSYL